jgi:hypothetical protein
MKTLVLLFIGMSWCRWLNVVRVTKTQGQQKKAAKSSVEVRSMWHDT